MDLACCCFHVAMMVDATPLTKDACIVPTIRSQQRFGRPVQRQPPAGQMYALGCLTNARSRLDGLFRGNHLLVLVRLLREIYEQLELDVPQCVVSTDADGQFVGSIDLLIPRSDIVNETVRCESAHFPTYAAAEQDAARRALRRLKDDYDLEVKDINYEDSVIYKNLYAHQTADYTVLFAQYNNLTREYNILKECYIATLAQKNEFINERIMLRQAIGECYAAVNRLTIEPPPAAADPSADMSNQLP